VSLRGGNDGRPVGRRCRWGRSEDEGGAGAVNEVSNGRAMLFDAGPRKMADGVDCLGPRGGSALARGSPSSVATPMLSRRSSHGARSTVSSAAHGAMRTERGCRRGGVGRWRGCATDGRDGSSWATASASLAPMLRSCSLRSKQQEVSHSHFSSNNVEASNSCGVHAAGAHVEASGRWRGSMATCGGCGDDAMAHAFKRWVRLTCGPSPLLI
jgi:hypothetical protein